MRGYKYKNIYEPLGTYLLRQPAPRVTLNFRQIHLILGTPLPKAARTDKQWWRNHRRSLQGSAWIRAGWYVMAVDLVSGEVIFMRPVVRTVQNVSGHPLWDRAAIRALRRHMKLNQREFGRLLGVSPRLIGAWETGWRHLPTYAMNRRLTVLAQEAKFQLN